MDRYVKSYYYWKLAITNILKSYEFIDVEHHYVKFAESLPTGFFSTLLEKRNYLLFPTEPSDDKEILQTAHCLSNLSNLHVISALNRKITRSINPNEFYKILDWFSSHISMVERTDKIDEKDHESIILALKSIREYFDLLRRVELADTYSPMLSFGECYALHRQEGAFRICPPRSSFAFAPVINTHLEDTVNIEGQSVKVSQADACRRGVVHGTISGGGFDQRQGDIIYPGMNLSFKLLNKNQSDFQNRAIAVTLNLLSIGGLDSVVSPSYTSDDELLTVLNESIFLGSTFPISDSPITKLQNLWQSSGQIDFFRLLIIGVAKLIIGGWDSKIDDLTLDVFFSELFKEVDNLINYHEVEFHKINPLSDNRCFLVGRDDTMETTSALRIMFKFFRKCKSPLTLLSMKNRIQYQKSVVDTFSPFVSYLRYNTGDINFVYILYRILRNLDVIIKNWPKTPKNRRNKLIKEDFGTWKQFNLEVNNSDWNKDIKKKKSTITRLRNRSADMEYFMGLKNKEKDECAWQNHGVFDLMMQNTTDAKFVWLSYFSKINLGQVICTSTKGSKINISDIASLLIEIIVVHKLIPLINIILEYIPPSTLINNYFNGHRPNIRNPLLRAHSFRRLQLIYQQTYDNAKDN